MTVSQDHKPSITAVASGYTRPPWTVSEVRTVEGSFMVLGGEGFGFGLIAEVTMEDDARLIAAAPEMVEALGVAANELEWQLERGNGNNVTRAALSIVRVAIAKATGQ